MSDSEKFVEAIGTHLPFLRRYSRALTGSQTTGDAYAAATLEAILNNDAVLNEDLEPRIALYRVFHSIWISSGAPVEVTETGLEASVQEHMAMLTRNTREALLLNTVENFPPSDIAKIMEVDVTEAQHLVDVAKEEMVKSSTGTVMIIEDESVIAEDLEEIIQELGHDVVGIARTRTEAVALAQEKKPDLILADIQLADNSSGIDAVNDILAENGDVPIIFITSFPERLLTGDKPEPAFMITKPYTDEQVLSSVSQAMFFASTETLKA